MPPLSSFTRTCLALAIGQAITLPSQAATIEVNSITDSPGPDCTLREAVESINAQSTPLQEGCYNSSSADLGTDDTITFDASLSGQTITLTNGQLVISNNTLSIIGLGQDQLTIDGNNASRVFNITAATVSLDSLTITGGNSELSNGGGIVAVLDSSVSLTHSTVSNNFAGNGGGINSVDSSVSLVNSTVSNNSAITYGGGIDARNSSNISLVSSTVSNNSANSGGGIYAINSNSVSLANSTVSNNSAVYSGGGISTRDSSIVSLNSTFSNNSAGSRGGGIYAVFDSHVSLTNSLVSGNTATISGDELNSDLYFLITADHNNLFGHNAINTTVAFTNFTPGATDIVATMDAAPAGIHLPTALSSILDTTLADNGCQEPAGAPASATCVKTNALVASSPAIDTADFSNCPGEDQRGKPRDEGFFISMVTSDGNGAVFDLGEGQCDIGSVEFSAGD